MEGQNNVALVSGGARGMGAAHVERLARGGYKVVAGDVLKEDGQALESRLRADGLDVRFHPLDVTNEGDWAAATAAAEDWFAAPVSALVNNAGILAYGGVDSLDLNDWRRVLDVNLTGVLLGIRAGADAMSRNGGGVIVNISSTAGLMGYGGLAAYTASKWGVRGLTKAAALDLAPKNIRVVSVHPGPIRTPMTAGIGDEMTSTQPIARFGEPEEVAELVYFLVTRATFSTGSEFVVDGGAITGQVVEIPQ
jgi:3alpha(or 20beta)-hydroxysteroid dehydrogenase